MKNRIKKSLKYITAGIAAFSLLSETIAVSAADITWNGAAKITESSTLNNGVYVSTTADQNALLIDTGSGTTVTVNDPSITKTGGTSNGDSYSFYGINSAVMCMGGGTTTITGGSVITNAAGANGIFSYGANNGKTNAAGDGTTVNISDTFITTTGNGSGGIMTTYGGTTNAENLTIETSGGSSAPIRTDRGGGWVTVDGGSYTSNGTGSPAIYSTADVDVSNATLISNESEGVCIEGNGSIELNSCTLTASNTTKNCNAQYLDSIMIYQSMSGDATGTGSEFSMTGGTLNSKNGHVFHVTNTSGTINLNGVTINNDDSENILLSVVNDGWTGNSNNAVLNSFNQTLEGDIIVSSASSTKSSKTSSLTLNLKDGSAFTGKIDDGNGGGNFNNVTVNIESGSTWTLTGDSYVTSITGDGTLDKNGYTLTTGLGSNTSDENNVSGDGNGDKPGTPPDGENGGNGGMPGLPPDGENGGNGDMPGLPSNGENGGNSGMPGLPPDGGNGEGPGLPPDAGNGPGPDGKEKEPINTTSGTMEIDSGTYRYSYTNTISYNGTKLSLTDFTIDGKKAGETLSGNVVLKKIQYKNNKKAGTAYAMPVFKAGSGADSETKNAVKKANDYFKNSPLKFTIEPCTLTKDMISGSTSYNFRSGKWNFSLKADTGSSKTVKLKYNRDFTVVNGSYDANTATVQIRGAGNYTGTVTLTLT